MSRIRAIFLGTPYLAAECLASMLQDEHFEIVQVFSQPDRPAGRKLQLQPSEVKKLALLSGVPVQTPESINRPEVIQEIKSLRAEVAVVVAFGQILSQEFLDLFANRVVNVHGSLLPRWRGAAPIQRAIMADDPETGVSLQVVVKKMDAGPVIGQRKLKMNDEWGALDLLKQMIPLSKDLLAIDLMDYLRGNLSAEPQDEVAITMAPKIDKTESRLNWARPARELFCHVRGLQVGMGPGASMAFPDGEIVKIHRVEVSDKAGTPGEVLVSNGEELVIGCGEGSLSLRQVQWPSKKQQEIKEFLRGHRISVGERCQ